MSIHRDLSKLVGEGVITPDTADKIRAYYGENRPNSQQILIILFAILGATLLALGVILVLAHNWDQLSRPVKLFFAFLPLIVGQAVCVFVLLRKRESIPWREASGIFLFFAVGAVISLVSQIYHIPGNLSSFLLTWMLLALPVVYLLPSSLVSLLYIAGISWYACETGYGTYPYTENYSYWWLLLLILPHYYLLIKRKPGSNFLTFHNWIIPLSMTIVLGTVSRDLVEWMFPAYIGLFGLFYQIGRLRFFRDQPVRNNGFLILGSAGTIVLLLTLTFQWYWDELRLTFRPENGILLQPEFITILVLMLPAFLLFFLRQRAEKWQQIDPVEPAFLAFGFIFLLGLAGTGAAILMNVLVFLVAIGIIIQGAKRTQLILLNYGLLIVSALITCRFFDTDLSYILKGILFLIVGVCFFLANFWILRNKKTNA